MNLSFANLSVSPLALSPDGAALAVGSSIVSGVVPRDVRAMLFGKLAGSLPLGNAEREVELDSYSDQAVLTDLVVDTASLGLDKQNILPLLVAALSGDAGGDPLVEHSDQLAAKFKRAAMSSTWPTLPSQVQTLSQQVAQATATSTPMASAFEIQALQNAHSVLPDIQATQNTAPAVAEIRLKQNNDLAMQAMPFRMPGQSRQIDGTLDTASGVSVARTAMAESSPQASLAMSLPQIESMPAKAGMSPNTSATTPEQKLLGVLGERISVQASQNIQHAVIRLDPHMSGSVRIELRHEAGVLQVRISASQADVTQQLQAISDGLRQELNNRQFNDVSVQISHGRNAEHGGRGGQPQHQHSEAPYQQTPGRALAVDATDDEAFDAAWKRANESRGYIA